MKSSKFLVISLISIILLSFLSLNLYAVEGEDTATEQANMLISTLDEQLDMNAISQKEKFSESVASPEIIGDQYYTANKVTVPEGIYDGNLYIMGDEVNFNKANVKGNVYVIAKYLKFEASTISGSLYTIAVSLEGANEFSVIDAYVIAQDINMDASVTVNRAFKAIGNNVVLNGNYTYDVDLLVGDINRDFSSMAPDRISDYLTSGKIESNLTLGNELVIGRMFNYAYEDEVAIPATASIGMVNYSKLDVPTPPNFEKIKSDFSALTKLLSVVIRLVNTAFVVVVLGWNCQRFRRLNQYHSGIGLFFKSLLKGSFGALGVFILSILLIISGGCIGIGAVGLGALAYGLCFAEAFAAAMIAINILGIREESNEGIGYKLSMLGIALVVGLAIWGIALIPIVGGYASMIFAILGLGGVIDIMFGNSKRVQTKYQNKMGRKYKNAKINATNDTPVEEPKLDNTEAFGNSSVMMENDSEVSNTPINEEVNTEVVDKVADTTNNEQINDSEKAPSEETNNDNNEENK